MEDERESIKKELNEIITRLYPKIKYISNIYLKDGYSNSLKGREDLIDEIIQTSILKILERCNKDPIKFKADIKNIDNYILSYIKNVSSWNNSNVLYNIRKRRNNEISFSDLDNYIDEDIDMDIDRELVNYNILLEGLNDDSNPFGLISHERIIIKSILIENKTYKELSKDLDMNIQKIRLIKSRAVKKIKNTL